MTYEEAHEYLNSLLVFGIKLGLENMVALCELLDNPQEDLKFIHVAGTNGKGSTCSMMAAALKNTGLKTGFYSSPFLYRFTERWRVNGLEVSEEQVASAIGRIAALEPELSKKTGVRPTYFEVLTAAALLIFKDAAVDVVVWETGMGGRLDATNVVVPLVSIITNIELDHTQYLGDTIEAIAYEKGGIVKEGIPFICGDKKTEVISYYKNLSSDRKSPVKFLGHDFSFQASEVFKYQTVLTRKVNYQSQKNDISIQLPNSGKYQCENAALAIAALEEVSEVLNISFTQAVSGLEAYIWPGRLEVRESGLILDGAHNPKGASTLVETLDEVFPEKQFDFICGILSDKNWQEVLDILIPKANSFIFVNVANERGTDSKTLENYLNEKEVEARSGFKVSEALERIEKPDKTIVVGSLYLIGEALSILNNGESVKVDSL